MRDPQIIRYIHFLTGTNCLRDMRLEYTALNFYLLFIYLDTRPTCWDHRYIVPHPAIGLIFVCLFFKTGFLFVALAVLELTLQIRLASNSEIRLPLTPVGVRSVHNTTAWLSPHFFFIWLSWTLFLDQAGLWILRFSCLCLPNAGIKGVHHNHLALGLTF